MARNFLVPINLNKNELQNVAIQNLAGDPASPAIGQIYYHSTNKELRYYDNTSWRIVTTGTISNLTFNNGGTGAASGSVFNGSGAVTISYNSIGAAPQASPIFTGTVNISSFTTAGVVLTSATGILSSNTAVPDTYLATISSSGKVLNSATTATASNTANAIVARDASGNFTAGIITATLNGAAASLTNSLTFSTGLSLDTGTTFNGSSAKTVSVDTNVIATVAYVDSVTAGLNVHDAVKYATTANLTSATYTAGSAGADGGTGVGATLVYPAAGNSIDGVTLVAQDATDKTRILVKNQTTLTHNGIYYVNAVSTSITLIRAADANNSTIGEVSAGDFVFVSDGNSNKSTGWTQKNSGTATSGTIKIGTDNIEYTQFSGAGTYLADESSLTLNGTTFSIKNTWGGQTNLITLGTVTTGTWNANTISASKGGTGTAGTITGIGYFNGTSAMTAANATQVINLLGSSAVANATTATNAQNIVVTNNTTATVAYPVWVGAAGTVSANSTTTNLSFNPSTGALSATSFVGSGANLTSLNVTSVSSGTLSAARGGTGADLSASTPYGLAYFSSAGVMASTGAGNTSAVLIGNASGAPTWTAISNIVTSNVNVTADDTTTNSNAQYLTFVTANTGSVGLKVSSSKLFYNPSSGTLSSTVFSGSGSGLTNLNSASLTAPSALAANGTSVTITAGTTTGTTTYGGNVSINGGAATSGTLSPYGGSVTILGGVATNSVDGFGGNVRIDAGQSGTNNGNGSIYIGDALASSIYIGKSTVFTYLYGQIYSPNLTANTSALNPILRLDPNGQIVKDTSTTSSFANITVANTITGSSSYGLNILGAPAGSTGQTLTISQPGVSTSAATNQIAITGAWYSGTSSTYSAGNVTITAGFANASTINPVIAGSVVITGGDSATTTSNFTAANKGGGRVVITGGTTATAVTTGIPGGIEIAGGNNSNTGSGGYVTITGGGNSSTGIGGAITIAGGQAQSGYQSGNVTITGGDNTNGLYVGHLLLGTTNTRTITIGGGSQLTTILIGKGSFQSSTTLPTQSITIQGNENSTTTGTSPAGGPVYIVGGSATGASGAARGGDVYLRGGNVTSGATGGSGYVSIGDSNTAQINIGGFTGSTAGTTQTITIGSATQTGLITIGRSTGSQTVGIATGDSNSKTINIGTGSTQSGTSITLGSPGVISNTIINSTSIKLPYINSGVAGFVKIANDGALSIDNGTYVKKYAENNGTITAVSGGVTWTVTHNLNTSNVLVQVYQNSGNALVDVDVVTTSANVVTLSFNSGSLTGSEYRAVVIG